MQRIMGRNVPESVSSERTGPVWCHTNSLQSCADMAHLLRSSQSEGGKVSEITSSFNLTV